jgi:NitT/TauT family transport system permease protein
VQAQSRSSAHGFDLHAPRRTGKTLTMATASLGIGQIADIQARPRRLWTQSLSWVLFLLGIMLYTQASIVRHKENPEDRVVPSGAQLWQGIKASVLEPSEDDDALDANASTLERVTHSMIWKDTASSARRFFIALALLVPVILLGLHMAVFPYAEALFLRFGLFFDKIVALSLLPILFIAFGIDDWSTIRSTSLSRFHASRLSKPSR